MIDRLDQRRRYLEKRAQIKGEMQWENRYEHEEAQSLAWALGQLYTRGVGHRRDWDGRVPPGCTA